VGGDAVSTRRGSEKEEQTVGGKRRDAAYLVGGRRTRPPGTRALGLEGKGGRDSCLELTKKKKVLVRLSSVEKEFCPCLGEGKRPLEEERGRNLAVEGWGLKRERIYYGRGGRAARKQVCYRKGKINAGQGGKKKRRVCNTRGEKESRRRGPCFGAIVEFTPKGKLFNIRPGSTPRIKTGGSTSQAGLLEG